MGLHEYPHCALSWTGSSTQEAWSCASTVLDAKRPQLGPSANIPAAGDLRGMLPWSLHIQSLFTKLLKKNKLTIYQVLGKSVSTLIILQQNYQWRFGGFWCTFPGPISAGGNCAWALVHQVLGVGMGLPLPTRMWRLQSPVYGIAATWHYHTPVKSVTRMNWVQARVVVTDINQ